MSVRIVAGSRVRFRNDADAEIGVVEYIELSKYGEQHDIIDVKWPNCTWSKWSRLALVSVDDAFWRPGRFDQIIEIKPPADGAAAEAGLAQMAARFGLGWGQLPLEQRRRVREIGDAHSMSHVEGYLARYAEDPAAVDGPGDRTFDPPVKWSETC